MADSGAVCVPEVPLAVADCARESTAEALKFDRDEGEGDDFLSVGFDCASFEFVECRPMDCLRHLSAICSSAARLNSWKLP